MQGFVDLVTKGCNSQDGKSAVDLLNGLTHFGGCAGGIVRGADQQLTYVRFASSRLPGREVSHRFRLFADLVIFRVCCDADDLDARRFERRSQTEMTADRVLVGHEFLNKG